MKKAAVVVLILATLMAGGLWALQRSLDRRLARVLPEAGRASKIPMAASILDFSLWRGAGGVRDLQIGNPPGFAESNLLTLAEGRVSVRYLPLLRRRIRFDDVLIRDADLTIIRDADGRFNIKRSGRAGGARGPGAGPGTDPSVEPGQTTGTVQQGNLPLVAIERLRGNLCIRMVDHAPKAGGDAPVDDGETVLRLQVNSTGLATYGDVTDESAWGVVTAEGSLEIRSHVSPLSLTARIAPLVDPKAPSFTLKGTLTGLDAEMLRPLLKGKDAGIKGEADRVEIDLVCEAGRYNESRSKLTVVLKNVKMGNSTTPSLTLVIPVHGTLQKPKLRLEQALYGALAQLLAAPPAENGSGTETGKKRHKSADVNDAISKGLEALLKSK